MGIQEIDNGDFHKLRGSSGFCGWSKELPGGRSWAVGRAGELWQVPLLVPSPGKVRTSVVSPLIPKHFSPGCFVINIPKGAEDFIKSLLLKGRLSDVCLQIPGSQQRLCELRLVLLARAGLGAGLPLLMGSTKFLSLNRPRRNMAGI